VVRTIPAYSRLGLWRRVSESRTVEKHHYKWESGFRGKLQLQLAEKRAPPMRTRQTPIPTNSVVFMFLKQLINAPLHHHQTRSQRVRRVN